MICSVPSCDFDAKTKGFCQKHYLRQLSGQSLEQPWDFPRDCPICGGSFTGGQKKKYCSDSCRDRAHYVRNNRREERQRYRESHREADRENNRNFYKRHRKERNKECRDYYKRTAPVRREKALEYYLEHLEERREYSRNREINYKTPSHRAASHKRRKRVRDSPFHHTGQDELHQYNMQRGKCCYCDKPILFEEADIDHVVPVSRGGNNGRGNILVACQTCNRSKSNKTLMEWRVWKSKIPK